MFKKHLARSLSNPARILGRGPIGWKGAIEKGSLNINELKQALIERIRQFSETCSKWHGVELCFGFLAEA
jgi:hypothetical protein